MIYEIFYNNYIQKKIVKWCVREDLNFHGFYPITTSTLRVYQFRHERILQIKN